MLFLKLKKDVVAQCYICKNVLKLCWLTSLLVIDDDDDDCNIWNTYVFSFTRLLVSGKRRDACVFLILSTVGHYSLFPLIFTQFGELAKSDYNF